MKARVAMILAVLARLLACMRVLGVDSAVMENSERWFGSFVEADFPFFSTVVDGRKVAGRGLPGTNLTARGVVLNLGHGCWAAFDLDLLRMSAVWDGPGMTDESMAAGSYHESGRKAPEGENWLPEPAGTVWLANGMYAGWQTTERPSLVDPRDSSPDPHEFGRGPLPEGDGRFGRIRLKRGRAALEYTVGGVQIYEQITAARETNRLVVRRYFALDRVPKPMWLILGRLAQTVPDFVPGIRTNLFRAEIEAASGSRMEPAGFAFLPGGVLAILVAESAGPVQLLVGISRNEPPKGPETKGFLPRAVKAADHRIWGGEVVTRGVLAESKGKAYVVDDIPLPVDNPWNRNVRLADLAFFTNGAAAGVTFDGDVWRIEGLAGGLEHVRWRRFASGLHEPLGIAIRAGDVFVHDRNGIWRLPDADADGEADSHELFANGFAQTAETREFASGLRVLPDGAFVIGKGGQRGATLGRHAGSVLRISTDGKEVTVLGHGFRQPFIGVHPRNGWVTVSDQQGHYTPSTPLHWLDGDRYHGFLPLFLPKEQYPEPIADPLTWIPHPINASGAGQVWLADAKMGPLTDALVHLGYYRPEAFVVRWHQLGSRRQAAVVSLTRDFSFAPLAGAVNPADGQLYLTGFQIWGTVAPRISGLARVRYTGEPDVLPTEVVAMDQGVLLQFAVALDPKVATDSSHYSAERWNYRRSAEYGSPHFRMDGSKGQDALRPGSVHLSKDRRSVFVAFADLKPVMQMRLGWALRTAEGQSFEQNAYFTPYELPRFIPESEGFEALEIDTTPRVSTATAIPTPATADEGRRLSELMGCVACHSSDGSTLGKVGPSWKGLYGKERKFADGSSAPALEDYLRESIREPARRVVGGFEKSDTGMPSYEGLLNEEQVEALILYIRSLR